MIELCRGDAVKGLIEKVRRAPYRFRSVCITSPFIDDVGLNVVGFAFVAVAARALGMCVGRYAVLMRVASGACSICGPAAMWASAPGIVVPGGARGGICAWPSRTARSCSPLCGRWFGRTASIHDIASRKRGETPGTTRFSIASPTRLRRKRNSSDGFAARWCIQLSF